MLTEIKMKTLKVRNVSDANRIIRKKYPRAFIVTYRYDKDFKFVHKDDRDWKNRKMRVAFIEDMRKIREVLKC